MERTLVLLKPDAVHRGLVGRILARFEDKGLKLVGIQMRRFPKARIEEHYAVHRERPFYSDLVSFMSSGPLVAVAIEGKDAIAVVRGLMGATKASEAAPGTIRGDFGMSVSHNLVHGSDGSDSAASELALWFPEADDTISWEPAGERWVYDVAEDLG